MSKLQYENIFKGKMGALYARIFDPETKQATTKTIKSIPNIFIHSNDKSKHTNLISIPEKQPLQKLTKNNE